MFSTAIVCYLFLGGAGGGLCFVLSILALLVPRQLVGSGIGSEYRAFFSRGYLFAGALLFVGCLCLLADSGNYAALPALFLSGRITYLGVGAYVLAITLVLCVLAFVFWRCSHGVRSRLFYILAFGIMALAALAVALCTGLFLSDIPSVAFWHQWSLPALFVASSLSCGLAAAPVVAWAAGVHWSFRTMLAKLMSADVAALGIEGLCAAVPLGSSLLATGEESTAASQLASAHELLFGDASLAFWAGFVVCGLVAPAAIELFCIRMNRRAEASFFLGSAALVFVGAFFMRYCIVAVGRHPVAYLMGA